MFEDSKLRVNDKHLRQRSKPPKTNSLELVDIFIKKESKPVQLNGCGAFRSREVNSHGNRQYRRKRRGSENESYADKQSQLGWSKRCPDSYQHETVRHKPIPFRSYPSVSITQLRGDDILEDKQVTHFYKRTRRLCKKYVSPAVKVKQIRRKLCSSNTSEVSQMHSEDLLSVDKFKPGHGLKYYDKTNSTSSTLLHETECSKRRETVAYSSQLFSSSTHTITPKTEQHNNFYEIQSVKSFSLRQTPAKLISNPLLYTNTLCSTSIDSRTPKRLPSPKPYEKTVFVYSVYDQMLNTPPKRKQAICLGSGTSFNIQFYRSMGDGERRDKRRYGLPCACTTSYTSIDMANVGRDEDGCICQKMRAPGYDYEGYTGYPLRRGSFLKRYLRVLLREQRRCMCGKKRQNRRPCPSRSKYNYNVGCQCRCKNNGRNFHRNDAACQCKYKEKIEHRPDRDIFCKDRGTTCRVPQCKCNSENVLNSNLSAQPAINVGSSFSFQVGFIKRCFENNQSTQQISSSIPNLQQYMSRAGRDGDCCCSQSNGRGPKSGSIASLLLSTLEPKIQCKRAKIGDGGDNCGCSENSSEDTLGNCCCDSTQTTRWKPPKYKSVGCKCDTDNPVSSVGVCCCISNAKNERSQNNVTDSNDAESAGCCCDQTTITDPVSGDLKEQNSSSEGTGERQPTTIFNFLKFNKKPHQGASRDQPEFKASQSDCKCDKKVITRAQQCCDCKKFDYKKAFGRLLLFNSVEDPICCSGGARDPFSKSVGFGEEDLRKPPCRQKGNYCPGIASEDNRTEVTIKNFFNRLIKQDTGYTSMEYRAFNPLNQNEIGIQHNSMEGPNERAGREIIYRNQGSSVPRARPMTVKEAEAMPNPALKAIDPKRKAVRIGSSCSFILELYRGLPPAKGSSKAGSKPDSKPGSKPGSKTGPSPPSAAPCPPPCVGPSATNDAPVRDRICIPTQRKPQQSLVKKAFTSAILKDRKQLDNSCQKCKKCVKGPLMKRAFAELLLSGSKQKKPKTCQRNLKTNTIEPNRKVVVRKPGKGAPGVKCDPYVCLKRINQQRSKECCK